MLQLNASFCQPSTSLHISNSSPHAFLTPIFASPVWHAKGLFMFCQCHFLSHSFSGPVEDKLSQNVHDRSSPNFHNRCIILVGMISFRDCSRDIVMVTDFWRESVKIGIPTFVLCAGIPQCMRGSQHGCAR